MKELSHSGRDIRSVEGTGGLLRADQPQPLKQVDASDKGVPVHPIFIADTKQPEPETPRRDDLGRDDKESRRRGRQVGSTDIGVHQRRQALREKLVPGVGLTASEVAAEYNVTRQQINYDLDRMVSEDMQNYVRDVRHDNPDADSLEETYNWLGQKLEPYVEASKSLNHRFKELEAEGKRTGASDWEEMGNLKEARAREQANPMRLALQRAMNRVGEDISKEYQVDPRFESLRERLIPGSGLTTNEVAAEYSLSGGQIRANLDKLIHQDSQNHVRQVLAENPDADRLQTTYDWLEQRREPYLEAGRQLSYKIDELKKQTGSYDRETITRLQEARERERTNPMRLALDRALDRVGDEILERKYGSKKPKLA